MNEIRKVKKGAKTASRAVTPIESVDGEVRAIERDGATPGQSAEQLAAAEAPDADASKAPHSSVDTRRRRARNGQKRFSVALSKVAHARLKRRADVRGLTVSAQAGEMISRELDTPQSEPLPPLPFDAGPKPSSG